MSKFQVKVTQVFRVEKTFVMEVEAPSEDEAVRLVDEREVDVPTADDDVDCLWGAGDWSLQNETVEIA